MCFRSLPALFAVLAVAAPVTSADTIDSPYYQGWVYWRPGATATMKTDVVAGGMKLTGRTTVTLKSMAADKAIVEIAFASEVDGMKVDSPAVPTDVPARQARWDAKTKVTTGKETLTVNGKKLECEWTQTETPEGEVTKTWMCKDVPGGVVRESIKSAGSASTSELVEWKGEKN